MYRLRALTERQFIEAADLFFTTTGLCINAKCAY